MDWFWGSSGDVGSVWFLPSGDVKSPYISRVRTTPPESDHTPPEGKIPRETYQTLTWLYWVALADKIGDNHHHHHHHHYHHHLQHHNSETNMCVLDGFPSKTKWGTMITGEWFCHTPPSVPPTIQSPFIVIINNQPSSSSIIEIIVIYDN